jgi:hypothetical protein
MLTTYIQRLAQAKSFCPSGPLENAAHRIFLNRNMAIDGDLDID